MVQLHHVISIGIEVDVFLEDLQRLTVNGIAKFFEANFLWTSLVDFINVIVQIFCDEVGGADIVAVGGVEDSFQLGEFLPLLP